MGRWADLALNVRIGPQSSVPEHLRHVEVPVLPPAGSPRVLGSGCCCLVLWAVEGIPWVHVTCLFCFLTLRVNILTLKSNSEKFPLPSEVRDSHILSTSIAESQIFSHSNLYLSVFHIAMKAVFHRIAIFHPRNYSASVCIGKWA